MKKGYLLVLMFILAAFKGFSQGNNLQFNQVLNIEFTTSGTTVTVPAGKVWKMESCALTGTNSYAAFLYNGQTYFIRQHNTSSSSWDVFPFWLGEGKTVTFGPGGYNGIMSIIEFNVVP